MKSNPVTTPLIRHKLLGKPIDAFLSLPLRFKITIPYLVVAILLAGLATWVITQSFVTKLQERFSVQLVDNFQIASTQMFQAESKALITERAIAHTIGVVEAVVAKDTVSLNALIRPLVINANAPLVHVLDNSGKLIYGLRLTSDGSERDEDIDLSAWMPVRRVLAGESDNLGDKFSGVAKGPGGPALYVVGPLILNGKQVGMALVGFPLESLLPQMVADSNAQLTIYQPDGQVAFSTFPQGVQMPALSSEVLTAINAKNLQHVLENRLTTLDANEYYEAIGPLLVRGQPSGWVIAVALPHTLITNSAQVSPTQLAGAFALAVLTIISLGVLIAKVISLPLFELVDASTRVANGDLKVEVQEQTRDEFGLLSRQFNQMVFQLRQRDIMRNLFGHMVSVEVREALLHGDELQLSGELKAVSVLFTDIRQFTYFSEIHSPKEVMDMLNIYFQIVNGAVRETGGMINKFGGDSTMAIFGAPIDLDPSESTYRALRAALLIRIRMEEASARRVQAGLKPINIGIGINSGEAITGNIGAEDRFEYTVIGDTVNVAARIQGLSSLYNDSNILISGETLKTFAEPARLMVTNQGEVELKGRTKLVQIYNLIGMRLAETLPEAKSESPIYINEVSRRDALETAYLYCREFDPTTISITKNLPLETIQLWLKQAVAQFEVTKQELYDEFGLTDVEIQRLDDAKIN